jgi:hypothetical protein
VSGYHLCNDCGLELHSDDPCPECSPPSLARRIADLEEAIAKVFCNDPVAIAAEHRIADRVRGRRQRRMEQGE